ncbi:MAG: tRNA (guanine(37)-N(1))-methyltransferase, partial [Clostridiales bacterium]|nr:tRNA (guanine(37)-N(1))-methyltransferase [Clostridiales bacterium]
MNFHVLTLFPEMIEQGLQTSITGRAMKNGLISLQAVNIRDYSENKHKQVDDYPYGGGAGMVMAPGPIYRAYKAVEESILDRNTRSNKEQKKTRVIYLTPQGKVFNQ